MSKGLSESEYLATRKELCEILADRSGHPAAKPSGADVVEAFVACLAASSLTEREMMMAALRSEVCIECGGPDPECARWEEVEGSEPS